jgi:hypothetical protein
MKERELAEKYEKQRGDMSQWESTPAKVRVRRQGGIVFSLRMSPQELELLRAKAAEEGTTISDVIRRAAIREARGERITVEWRMPQTPAGATFWEVGLPKGLLEPTKCYLEARDWIAERDLSAECAVLTH